MTERLQEYTQEYGGPQPVTLEAMEADPEIFKRRLLLLIRGLPWEQSVRNVRGAQAEGLVRFCLDTDESKLDIIGESLDRISEDRLEDPELIDSLEDIRAAEPINRFGPEGKSMAAEKILRQRLLAWADYLNNLMSSGVHATKPDDDSAA